MRRILIGVLSATLLLGVNVTSGAASRDSDGDGMPDRWEVRHHLDPHRANAMGDPDGDHLSNVQEYLHHSDPHALDTDRDGLRDGAEVKRFHTDPAVADSIVGLLRGVQCPNRDSEPPDRTCAPFPLFAAVVELENGNGDTVGTATTDAWGRFSFREAGTYSLVPQNVKGFAPPGRVGPSRYGEPATRVAVVYENDAGPGVAGQVTESPTCPVEREYESCVAALSGAVIDAKDSVGHIVGSDTSDDEGRYEIALPPGTYTIVPEPSDKAMSAPESRTITVAGSDSGAHHVDFDYDTGIR